MHNFTSTKIRIKITLLGDEATGKSSILNRYKNNQFNQHYNPTIGVDFVTKNILRRNNNWILYLWDSGGQEKFRNLFSVYVKEAKCILVIFDITSKKSINNIDYWVKFYRDFDPNDLIILVANKIQNSKNDYLESLVMKKVMALGLAYYRVSAKTGQNISQLFFKVIQAIEEKFFNIIHQNDK